MEVPLRVEKRKQKKEKDKLGVGVHVNSPGHYGGIAPWEGKGGSSH